MWGGGGLPVLVVAAMQAIVALASLVLRVEGNLRSGWRGVFIIAVKWQPRGVNAVRLQVLPQGGGVGVGLVTAAHPAGVGLVGGVDVHVLLPVARVGEPPVAAFNLALKRLLACNDIVE